MARLQEELEQTRKISADVSDDLAALKTFLNELLSLEGIEPDDIAVGTALAYEIAARWPKNYEPKIETLAKRSRTSNGQVAAALDMFAERGLVRTNG